MALGHFNGIAYTKYREAILQSHYYLLFCTVLLLHNLVVFSYCLYASLSQIYALLHSFEGHYFKLNLVFMKDILYFKVLECILLAVIPCFNLSRPPQLSNMDKRYLFWLQISPHKIYATAKFVVQKYDIRLNSGEIMYSFLDYEPHYGFLYFFSFVLIFAYNA